MMQNSGEINVRNLAIGTPLNPNIIDQTRKEIVQGNMNFGQDISDFKVSKDPSKNLATGTAALFKNKRFPQESPNTTKGLFDYSKVQGHNDFKVSQDFTKNARGANDEFHLQNFARGFATGKHYIDQKDFPDDIDIRGEVFIQNNDFEIGKKQYYHIDGYTEEHLMFNGKVNRSKMISELVLFKPRIDILAAFSHPRNL